MGNPDLWVEWKYVFMDGPSGCYAKWHKLDKEKQIPYDFIYMCKLKVKINEQIKQKQIHRFREQTDACQMGGGLGS